MLLRLVLEEWPRLRAWLAATVDRAESRTAELTTVDTDFLAASQEAQEQAGRRARERARAQARANR